MTTPNVNAKTSKLFFSLVAGSLLVAAPVIVMGCSGSTTAPFVAITPTPTGAPTDVVTVEPAVPDATSATYRILVSLPPASLTGTISAGGVTFSKASLQTVPGKTVFVNSTLPPVPLAEFTEIDLSELTADPPVDFTTICFEVDAPPDPAIIAQSDACSP